MGKRGQAWGFDLMIAAALFTTGIIMFYFYAINSSNETDNIISRMDYDANLIADTLLSEGYPSNWDEATVISPGLLSESKIDNTKLEKFYNISSNNYNNTKSLFNTRYNYYINLSDTIVINNVQIDGIGLTPQGENNILKVERIVVYNNKAATFSVLVWD